MRRMLAILAVLVSAAPAAWGLAIGEPIPASDVKMEGVDGRSVSLSDLAGKRGTLVIFSCNHCPWVQAWEGRLVEIGDAYPAKGIGVVFVNSNDPAEYPEDGLESMKTRAREHRYGFPYVVDASSAVARAFGATHTPEAFLFDAGGILVYHGAVDDNARHPEAVTRAYLRDALEALLAGRRVDPTETKSLGCSIKLTR